MLADPGGEAVVGHLTRALAPASPGYEDRVVAATALAVSRLAGAAGPQVGQPLSVRQSHTIAPAIPATAARTQTTIRTGVGRRRSCGMAPIGTATAPVRIRSRTTNARASSGPVTSQCTGFADASWLMTSPGSMISHHLRPAKDPSSPVVAFGPDEAAR